MFKNIPLLIGAIVLALIVVGTLMATAKTPSDIHYGYIYSKTGGLYERPYSSALNGGSPPQR